MPLRERLMDESDVRVNNADVSIEVIENCGRQAGEVHTSVLSAMKDMTIEAGSAANDEADWAKALDAFGV